MRAGGVAPATCEYTSEATVKSILETRRLAIRVSTRLRYVFIGVALFGRAWHIRYTPRAGWFAIRV